MCRKLLIFSLMLLLGSVQCLLFFSLTECEKYLNDYLKNNRQCKLYFAQCKNITEDFKKEIFCESLTRNYKVKFQLDGNQRPRFHGESGFDLHFDKNITCIEVFNVSVDSTVKYDSRSVAVVDINSQAILSPSDEFISFQYEFKKAVQLYALVIKRKEFEFQEHRSYFNKVKVIFYDADMIDYKNCDPKSHSKIEINLLEMPPKYGTIVSLNMVCTKIIGFKYEKVLPWLTNSAPGIKKFNISGCTFFYPEDKKLMPELTHLYLRNSGVFEIVKTLNYTPKLQVLDLPNNKLTRIDKIFFNSLQNLRELDISGTRLEFLDDEEMNIQTSIQVLRASHLYCQYCSSCVDKNYRTTACKDEERDKLLTELVPNILNLRSVNLSYNDITHIPSTAFQNVAANGVIILEHNKIENLESLQLRSLYLLDLSHNSIQSLGNIIISGEIETLNLEFNNIRTWESSDVFHSDQVHIKHLNLSYNEITAFDETMINSLEFLESVDIGGNSFDCNDCSLDNFQQWLKLKKRTQVTNLGASYTTLQCKNPADLLGKLLLDAPLNEVCTAKQRLILWITIPIPILIIVFGLLIYVYRFQLFYIIHMIRVRNRGKNKVPERTFDYNAFVSYSSVDRSWVHDVLLKTLESDENKYKLCVHERDFRLGGYIMDNVSECIERSRNVILILSPNFVSSTWCQWELKLVQQLMFENNPNFLILVELEKLRHSHLPSTLRLLMSTRTYLECPRAGADMNNFWTRLKQALGRPLDATECQVEESQPENPIEDMHDMLQLAIIEVRSEIRQEGMV